MRSVQLLALLWCCLSTAGSPPPVPSAGPFKNGEYDERYVSALLDYFDCDVRNAVAHVMRPDNPQVMKMRQGNGPVEKGGFGAQMVVNLVPAMSTAFLFGMRLAPDLASTPWNYGCPGHETASQVLKSLISSGNISAGYCAQSSAGPENCVKLVTGSTVELAWKQSTCHGDPIPFSAIRNATADFLFSLTPYFAERVASMVASLRLPDPEPFLAVHLRGGDKLVAEWTGPFGHLSKPEHWIESIVAAAAHEQSHYSPNLSNRIFIESDDCALLLHVANRLNSEVAPNGQNFSVVHLPCVVPPPAMYSQRGHSAAITGHHQGNFNANHTCEDTIRYFVGLTVFRDATAVLLGPGGANGGALRTPARQSSNTILFIELLRGGRAKKPVGREYHIGRKTGGANLEFN